MVSSDEAKHEKYDRTGHVKQVEMEGMVKITITQISPGCVLVDPGPGWKTFSISSDHHGIRIESTLK